MDEERIKILLMGLLDGELTDEENREIHEHLRRSEKLRQEYESLLELNGTLEILGSTTIDERQLRKVWKSPFRRGLRALSYSMIGAGFGVLLSMGLYRYFEHGKGTLLTNVCVGGILAGFLLLLLQVIRDRWLIYRNDPYKDIEK